MSIMSTENYALLQMCILDRKLRILCLG